MLRSETYFDPLLMGISSKFPKIKYCPKWIKTCDMLFSKEESINDSNFCKVGFSPSKTKKKIIYFNDSL